MASRDHAPIIGIALDGPGLNTDHAAEDYCYQPCRFGLHVCGEHPDGVNCLTVANVAVRSASEARRLFELARQECAVAEGEPDDLVVDLQIDWDCSEDFLMTRQMLDRLKSLVVAA